MSKSRRSTRLRVALCVMTTLTLARWRAGAAPPETPASRGEARGSDVFVMAREALLRDKPSKQSRFVGRLPGGSRVQLLEPGDQYLKVAVVAGDAPGEKMEGKGAAEGYLSREVASIFSPDASGTADLVAAGRALAASEGHRRLAAAFLLRASQRLRTAGAGDPAVEVLLGETAESLAGNSGPFPPGLEVASQPRPAPGPSRWIYAGEAFRRAVELTAKAEGEEASALRERALAGMLRQQYPDQSSSLTTLWQETAAWLELAESARDASALRSSGDRLGSASLSLGRLLLAAGRLEDLDKVERRVRGAAARIQSLLPGDVRGKRLSSRAQILRAMRGDGTPAFPQEKRARVGPKELTVRISGKPGALELAVEATVGGTHDGPRKKSAVPVLPVPGSLRVSPDGKSAAWVEVAGPARLVPVVTSLEKDEPAREVAILSAGRPLRDNALAHVVSTLSGYSKDGQRLGVSVQAWNDTPGPEARYSVVSVATGELLFETSRDLKSFQRLIE